MKYCLLAIWWICISAPVRADPGDPKDPPPGRRPLVITLDPVVTSDSATCILPFTRAGNLILVRAKADTTDGFFVFDTGAPNLVLNITYFRRYPTTNPTESGGVTGAVVNALQTHVDSVHLGPVHYFHLDADLINLGHIENTKGVKIFGLLGMKLFEKFEVIIDYDQSLIYLHLLTRKDGPGYRSALLNDTSAYGTVPIDLDADKIIVHTTLKGKKLRFVVDSGAETSVLDSRLPNKVFESVEVTRRVHLSGSGNTRVDALYGNLKDLQLGDQTIASLPVLITNLQSMCDAYNNCIDGMLSFDFLSLHKIGFNFVSRKMYIWK
ncbi:pepsin/retropepsin-like aspartic protease family protein [Dinghuibacter silviterrae]|uniref:Aspartyl protease n=1 Tax=Dinghuibacter silviterrae TaxID=1539049 RepID=A0A4R8DFU4_9BACT|nr:pepsin/retropepsin-like aspartic protease family protein [Dinghuibacter silviterrae]TDW96483.1 aspartyl protease [Dinghuibacter silviterrae]